MTDPSRTGPRADTGKRFLALLIDAVLLGVVNAVFFGLLGVAGRGLGLLVNLAYFAYFEGGASGQTVGKHVMGIRVIDFQTGQPLGAGKAILRWVGRLPSSIPCGLGYFWAIWDGQHQTWHDKIAGTVVVPVDAYPVSSWP